MQKLVLPLLLPPLLSSCAGFTTRSVPQDTPALVFVDGQISESADIIALTQQRLAPPRPATASVMPAHQARNETRPPSGPDYPPPPATSLPSKQPAIPGLVMTGAPQPAAVLSLSPARNLTLEQWVRRIMPTGWKLEYENALRAKLNIRIVSVYTNDQWTRVLGRLLAEQSMTGNVDWNTQAVTLRRAGQSFPLSSPATSPVSGATTTPRNPFSGEPTAAQPTATSPVSTTATPVIPAKTRYNPPGQPVMPAAVGKTWQAAAGATLRETLLKWAKEQRCESGASPTWTVIWPTAVTDYRLDAPLTFRGTFESMLGQMFDLYRTAQTPLYAEASRLQCLVSVSDSPAGH